MSSPRESTAYAYPAVPTLARSMTCGTERRSISATTTPRPGARSATEIVMWGRAPLEIDAARIPFLRPRADEIRAPGEVDPAVESVDLEQGGADTLLPGRVEVAQSTDGLVTLEEAVEVLVSLRQSGSARRDGRLGYRLELPQDFLHLLLDRGGGRRRLVPLDGAQRALAVLIGEVELREPDRDDRRGDERHDDRRVLPDQAPVRPYGRFHAAALRRDRRLSVDLVSRDDHVLRHLDAEPACGLEIDRELDVRDRPPRPGRQVACP